MSDKQVIVHGDYYEQSGNLGAGHVSESEIKEKAELGGVINEAEQYTKSTQGETVQERKWEEDKPFYNLPQSDYGKFIGDSIGRLIPAFAQDRELYCERCKGHTEHRVLTISDIAEVDKDLHEAVRIFLKTLVKVNDFNPLTGLIMGNMYKCKKCKRERTYGSLINDEKNI